MTALGRFVALGMRDADSRVGTALTAPSSRAADRYLRDSATVKAIDHATLRLQRWMVESISRRLVGAVGAMILPADPKTRYRSIALLLCTAVTVHAILTLLNGPRPGWFWVIVPGLATLFALLLLASSRDGQLSD